MAPTSSEVITKTTPEDCLHETGNIDCDPDDIVGITDLVWLIDNMFINGIPICCPGEANVDGDPMENVDIADLTLLIAHLFINFEPLSSCR